MLCYVFAQAQTQLHTRSHAHKHAVRQGMHTRNAQDVQHMSTHVHAQTHTHACATHSRAGAVHVARHVILRDSECGVRCACVCMRERGTEQHTQHAHSHLHPVVEVALPSPLLCWVLLLIWQLVLLLLLLLVWAAVVQLQEVAVSRLGVRLDQLRCWAPCAQTCAASLWVAALAPSAPCAAVVVQLGVREAVEGLPACLLVAALHASGT